MQLIFIPSNLKLRGATPAIALTEPDLTPPKLTSPRRTTYQHFTSELAAMQPLSIQSCITTALTFKRS